MIDLASLKAGNRKSQKEFYSQYKISMFKLCRLYLADRHKAEDALQEGFIQAFKNIHTFDGDKGSMNTWIRKIFTNICLMQLRKEKSSFSIVEIESVIHTLKQSFDDKTLNTLSLRQIYDLLHRLPDGYRSVFVLYFIEGFTHLEISAVLGISENTSKSQLYKSKKKMQELIIENFPNQYSQYAKTMN